MNFTTLEELLKFAVKHSDTHRVLFYQNEAVLVTRNPFAEIATVEDWHCTGIVKYLQDDDDQLLTRGASSLLKMAKEVVY